jgi:hypothetical protein
VRQQPALRPAFVMLSRRCIKFRHHEAVNFGRRTPITVTRTRSRRHGNDRTAPIVHDQECRELFAIVVLPLSAFQDIAREPKADPLEPGVLGSLKFGPRPGVAHQRSCGRSRSQGQGRDRAERPSRQQTPHRIEPRTRSLGSKARTPQSRLAEARRGSPPSPNPRRPRRRCVLPGGW